MRVEVYLEGAFGRRFFGEEGNPRMQSVGLGGFQLCGALTRCLFTWFVFRFV